LLGTFLKKQRHSSFITTIKVLHALDNQNQALIELSQTTLYAHVLHCFRDIVANWSNSRFFITSAFPVAVI